MAADQDYHGITRRLMARIMRAVRRIEQQPLEGGWDNPAAPIAAAMPPPEWALLTENLLPGSFAQARPEVWDSTAASGDGALSFDYGQYIKVEDLTSSHWGLAGEKVLIRRRLTQNGVRYEAIRPGAPWYEGTLSTLLNAGSTATATVSIGGTNTTVTVADRFLASGASLASGKKVGITCDANNNRFVATEAPC